MKGILQLVILFLFLCHNIFAQYAIGNDARYISPQKDGYLCGGKTVYAGIISSIAGIDTTLYIPSDKNPLFLEIAHKNTPNKFVKIPHTGLEFTNGIMGIFKLPDSLQMGRTYLFRLSIAGNKVVTGAQQIIYGLKGLPFLVNFEQEKVIFDTEVSLDVKFSTKNEGVNLNGNTYELKLFDNTSNISYNLKKINPGNLIIPVRDSLTIFRITEIYNECGVKGEVKGEAKVTKSKFPNAISIKNINPEISVCKSEKFRFQITSYALTSKSIIKVQFADNYDFYNATSTVAEIDKNNIVSVSLPNWVAEGKRVYYRVVSENPNLTSIYQEIYVASKPTHIELNYNFSSDELSLYFRQYVNNTESNTYFTLNQAVVNGIDLTKNPLFEGNRINIPFPKKDTSFTITKASNICGDMIPRGTVNFFVKKNIHISKNAVKKEVCENEEVVFTFDSENQELLKTIDFYSFIEIRGEKFDESLQKYSGEFVLPSIFSGYGQVDYAKKIVKFKIPTNSIQNSINSLGNSKFRLTEIYLNAWAYSRESGVRVSENYSPVKINIAPQVKLTESVVNVNSGSYVNLPIKFIGGGTINLKLSDGQSFTLDPNTICPSCINLYGQDYRLNVGLLQQSSFRVTSVENKCGLGTTSGETKLNIKTIGQGIDIIEDKLPKLICKSVPVEIPFKLVGQWQSNKKLYAVLAYKSNRNYNNPVVYERRLVDSSPLRLLIDNKREYGEVDISFESDDLIKSQLVTLKILSQPNSINIASETASKTYLDNTEILMISDTESSIYLGVSGRGGALKFTINGKVQENSIDSDDFTWITSFPTIKKDSSFIINSVSNACGTLELNRKVQITKVPLVFRSVLDNTYYSIYNTFSSCSGARRVIKYSYQGKLPERNDITVQLAKVNSSSKNNPLKLNFFNVQTVQGNGEVTYTIPDTCSGNYAYRLYLKSENLYSDYFENSIPTIRPRPVVKLVGKGGLNEVNANPNAQLFLNANIQESGTVKVILSDGGIYSSYDFGINFQTKFNDSLKTYYSVLNNEGKVFKPKLTTTYTIKEVYNDCGLGTSSGSVKVNVLGSIEAKLSNDDVKSHFCEGDSVSLEFSYLGNFPKDTLMGVYLHNTTQSSFSKELGTFKNLANTFKSKLPININSGEYFIQIRKKSRNQVNPEFFVPNKYDSVLVAKATEQLDTKPVNFFISTAPNIELSGNAEIFKGQTANLSISQRNFNNINTNISKDTILNYYFLPYIYSFTDSSEFTGIANNTLLSVKPQATKTYTVLKAKNYCGIGKAVGSATVSVLENAENRIQPLGFPTKYSQAEWKDYYYYTNSKNFCAGIKDSIDVQIYGSAKKDYTQYQIALSDKNGDNFAKINTLGSKIVYSSRSLETIRFLFEIPKDAMYGYNYRIKVIPNDNIASVALENPIKIFEIPSAKLTGKATVLFGEKPEAIVSFTGDSPWFVNISDAEGNKIYQGLPNKTNSNIAFAKKAIYTNEFRVSLNPSKSTVYKITDFENLQCGIGKIEGELSVDLITSTELSQQSRISIFPNPTSSYLKIDLSELSEPTILEIYSTTGILLKSYHYEVSELQTKQSIDTSDLKMGIYLFKIRNSKLIQTYKIVKN